MRKIARLRWVWIIIVLAISLSTFTHASNFEVNAESLTPYEMMHKGMDLIEEHGINSNSQEWQEYREVVNEEGEDISEGAAKYRLTRAVTIGGGSLSYLFEEDNFYDGGQELIAWIMQEGTAPNTDEEILEAELAWEIEYPTIEELEAGYYYIDIPYTMTYNNTILNKYINQTTTFFNEVDPKSVKGIILNLRNSNGPIEAIYLATLSPFLNEGEQFYYVNNKEEKIPVILDNNQIKVGDNVHFEFEPSQHKIQAPIVILTDRTTANIGEMAIVALRNSQANIHILGNATYGTVNKISQYTIELPHSMGLVTHYVESVDGEVYHNNPIQPDTEMTDSLEVLIEEGLNLLKEMNS